MGTLLISMDAAQHVPARLAGPAQEEASLQSPLVLQSVMTFCELGMKPAETMTIQMETAAQVHVEQKLDSPAMILSILLNAPQYVETLLSDLPRLVTTVILLTGTDAPLLA